MALALKLGLDLLLGGFAAGIIVRLALRGREVTVFESKLTAIGYGFLIPFFFIVSGMQFDLNALTGSATAMLKLPLFVALSSSSAGSRRSFSIAASLMPATGLPSASSPQRNWLSSSRSPRSPSPPAKCVRRPPRR